MDPMNTVTHCKNVDKCCRTCLNDASNKMYDIFTETTGNLNAAQILTLCTKLKVNLARILCKCCF